VYWRRAIADAGVFARVMFYGQGLGGSTDSFCFKELEALTMKVTRKMWLMIISASLLVGAAVGVGMGLASLASMHPSASEPASSTPRK